MATVAYDSLLPDIIPMAPEAPDMLITKHIRASVVELCEKTSVYQIELDPISSVSGQYEYEFDAPAGTSVQKVLWVTHDGRDLEPISSALLEQRKPKWRTSEAATTGVPEFYVKQSSSAFWVVPPPSATVADAIRVRAILRPTHTSNSCEAEIMNDYRDTIINGALFRVLRTPGYGFTDYAGGQVYASLYNSQLEDAERRARFGDTPIVRKVGYGGLTSVRGTRKYSGRRLYRSNNM